MRLARSARGLKPTEIDYARNVFHRSLPPFPAIGITDGLGVNGTVFVMTRVMIPFGSSVKSSLFDYYINFGDASKEDLSTPAVTLSQYVPGYPENMCDVFIHELTHVWQYAQPRASSWDIAVRCYYAQKVGAGYSFTAGDPWNSYNLEQQASIVEEWNRRDRKEDDELFPYIHYLIRKENPYLSDPKPGYRFDGHRYTEGWFFNDATLSELKVLLEMERTPTRRDPPWNPTTAKDDSIVVIVEGDILFDFDKAVLKPAAEAALGKAWARLQHGEAEKAWELHKSGPLTASPSRRKVFFFGHTDSVGDDGYNMHLSEQRAKAVAEWFLRRGYLLRSEVKTEGLGKSAPLAPNTTPEGRAKNRRVEIHLSNK